MKLLEVTSLCKQYPQFELSDVSFSLDKGVIMGFIGKNGAGKSTTLKSLLNLVHPSKGTIKFFGLDFHENEREIKRRIGYAAGEVDYYPKKKIKTIIKYTKPFFSNWDDEACEKYMRLFELDPEKKLVELSCGMRVKFSILLALSHHAELLLLDEPTSGLDPVSRDDLTNIFLNLRDEGISILFSTHITTDLDKCADEITYIRKGKIIESGKMSDFIDKYLLVRLPDVKACEKYLDKIVGIDRTKDYVTALISAADAKEFSQFEVLKPNLEEVMIHMES